MKHLTMTDKSLLVGDETASLLLEYAALLGKSNSADTVTFHAFSSDGDEVEASLLLNSGTSVMIESTHTSLPEPGNADVEAYLRDRIDSYTLNTPDELLGPDEVRADRQD